MRKVLTILTAAFALTAFALPAFAGGNEQTDFCDPANKPGGVALSVWLAQNGNPDCIDLAVSQECGVVAGTISRNETPWGWAVAFEEGAATYNLGAATFGSRSFAEDYNGGSVEVSYYLVGPESDYGMLSQEPNFWSENAATLTVDTDCEDPAVPPVVVAECTTLTITSEGSWFVQIGAGFDTFTGDHVFTGQSGEEWAVWFNDELIASGVFADCTTTTTVADGGGGTVPNDGGVAPTVTTAPSQGGGLDAQPQISFPSTTKAVTLPFTGPSDSLPFLILAGLTALGLGGLMVRSARSDG